MTDSFSLIADTILSIKDAAVKFEIETGKKPVSIYLGKTEMEILKTYSEEGMSVAYNDDGYARPKICGLLVYAVYDKTHIACTC